MKFDREDEEEQENEIHPEQEDWLDAEEEVNTSEEQETTEENEDEDIDEQINDEDLRGTARKSERQRKQPDRYRDYVMMAYTEGVTGPERDNWIKAIKEEKRSLEEKNTWEIVEIKQAKSLKPLKSKWVFRIKRDVTYKARLVVRGCEQ